MAKIEDVAGRARVHDTPELEEFYARLDAEERAGAVRGADEREGVGEERAAEERDDDGEQARRDEVGDRVDRQRPQRVDLLGDFHRANFCRH